MSLEINIFLLLFGGLQGLLLAFFLIRKKASREAYGLLAVYLGIMILQIILKVMSKVWLMENLQPLYDLSYLFPFLYGPLAYLFTVHFLKPGTKRSINELFHMVPFGLSVIALVAELTIREHTLLGFLFLNPRINTWMQLLSVIGYHGWALLAWSKDNRPAGSKVNGLHPVQATWLRQFILGSMAVCTIITLAIYFMYAYHPSLSYVKWVFVALSLFIYWISYTAIQQPDVFAVIRGGSNPMLLPLPATNLTIHRHGRRYNNSGLTMDESKRIAAAVQKVVDTEKPYLDPEMSIEQLAKKVECSRHHLSQVLNEVYRKSFYEFINHLRVAEAKNILSDPAPRPVKIASVGFDSGFSSISTFNEVFKKIVGMTPSHYRSLREEERRLAGSSSR